ncbi:MAG TPA: RNA methyltransferase [Phycisphaerae bacterium]|nr:RNA methyltransferase [Phycisphaerae bacterium]
MAESISSLSNPRIKALAELRRKGVRADPSRILIDGIREIGRAVEAGIALSELYYCPSLLEAPSEQIRKLASAKTELIELTEPVFEKIRYGDRTGGLVAVAARPHRTLADLKLGANPLIAVVEKIGKPGNLGGMLRSADGAGLEAVLAVDSAIDVYGPNVIRASVAAVFRIPVVEISAEEARRFLDEHRFQSVAASPTGQTDYTRLDYRKATAFIFGAEDKGLSERWTGIQTARVPMRGIGDSLNVSTTAALFFYEALRQRTR